MEKEDVVSGIVRGLEGLTIGYEEIEFKGVALIITKSKLKPLIAITWERTHYTELEKFAEKIPFFLEVI